MTKRNKLVKIKAPYSPKQKERDANENRIVVQQIPDPLKREIKHRIHLAGKTTGLGIWEYLATIFAANETLSRPRKLTDEAIRVSVIKEFDGIRRKGQKGIADRMREEPWLVAKMRTRYNKGELTRGEVPNPKSRRYDNDGKPVT